MPDISKQLEAQVIAAKNNKTLLNIVGGGSKAFIGRDAIGEPLHVGSHTGIVSYQPVELVLTARAGTRLTAIESALDEQGQMLAFEPPHLGDTDTLGGTLACNLSGPSRPWGGSVRDHVLGIRLINGRGEHLRFGGQVMKNVAGYDVSRLQAGAMGTLGVMTEISLKVLPKPAYSVTISQKMSADDAILLMNERAGIAKPLTAACWMNGILYLRLAGAKSAVEATLQQWGGTQLDEADHFWRSVRDQRATFFDHTEKLWRFSIKPTVTLSLAAEQQLIDWGGAQRWYRGEVSLDAMQAVAAEAGGQVSLFKGGDRQADVFHDQADALKRIQVRLKKSFDPSGIFNSGRLYSWL
ncbi:MAG: glycolate oxidase subunit GlcE [Leucothrix sp.]